jgi:hypothetical protein
VAGANGFLRALRRETCVVGVDLHIGLQLWCFLRDAGKVRLDNIDGGELARGDLRGKLMSGKVR